MHREVHTWEQRESRSETVCILNNLRKVIWAASSELGAYRLCEQRRFRRACAVSPEPPLLAHTSSESRGTFRQKAKSLAPLNGWACAVKSCHDGMLEDTNSPDASHLQLDEMTKKLVSRDKQEEIDKALRERKKAMRRLARSKFRSATGRKEIAYMHTRINAVVTMQ